MLGNQSYVTIYINNNSIFIQYSGVILFFIWKLSIIHMLETHNASTNKVTFFVDYIYSNLHVSQCILLTTLYNNLIKVFKSLNTQLELIPLIILYHFTI
jgi:hypothetical protein